MFHYIHGYQAEYWPGLVRAGLIDDTSGLKLTQHGLTDPGNTFNALARAGGAVHAIIREANRPFYIDRLQGGTFFYPYRFDAELVRLYLDMLGDRFYGFQMHEWASNLVTDWQFLAQVAPENWSAEGIEQTIRSLCPYPYLNLSCHSVAEYATLGKPANTEDFIRQAEALFAKRQQEHLGLLLPADSYFMAPMIELTLGAKRLMPEVGAQIPDMRVQMAYTRGMARGAGVPWGVYYEPWGGKPFGVCYYKTDNVNEWNIADDGDFQYVRTGANGGSSRSLQARLHRYAYLSGASFISEEWGLSNTFYDWQDFVLTPYGQVKKDFLAFVRKYPDVGVPETVAAVVLPRDWPILDLNSLRHDTYLGFAVTGPERDRLHQVRAGLNQLFGSLSGALGNEAHVIKNGGCPDVLDIVHQGDEQALARYRLLVDLTGDPSFAHAYPNVCTPGEADRQLRSLLPCQVDGAVHWLLNRCATGWLLAVFNHNGIERTVEHGEVLLEQAAAEAVLSLRPGLNFKLLEGTETVSCQEDQWQIHLPAGGWLLARLT